MQEDRYGRHTAQTQLQELIIALMGYRGRSRELLVWSHSNSVMTNKFKLALGHLICLFTTDEIPKNNGEIKHLRLVYTRHGTLGCNGVHT